MNCRYYPSCGCIDTCYWYYEEEMKKQEELEDAYWEEIAREQWEEHIADYYAQQNEQDEYYSGFDDNSNLWT